MFNLHIKFNANSLFCSLSNFECDGHTVHMLTQWCLLLPLTCIVKLSLFTHVHSSPLSLTARLHQCCANSSHYTNNDWTFSRQASFTVSRRGTFVVIVWAESLHSGTELGGETVVCFSPSDTLVGTVREIITPDIFCLPSKQGTYSL